MCQVLISLVGFIFDLIAFLACGAAFLAPYWVHVPPNIIDKTKTLISMFPGADPVARDSYEFDGLLARCWPAPDNTCRWFWQNDFDMEKDLPNWHKAAQALYSFGYVILLSTVLLALLHVCCRCCCQKAFSLATVIGSLILAGFVLIAAAVSVFGAFQHTEKNIQLDNTGDGQFYWMMYLAAGGLVSALLASILFFCDGCRGQRAYEGYETTRMI